MDPEPRMLREEGNKSLPDGARCTKHADFDLSRVFWAVHVEVNGAVRTPDNDGSWTDCGGAVVDNGEVVNGEAALILANLLRRPERSR